TGVPIGERGGGARSPAASVGTTSTCICGTSSDTQSQCPFSRSAPGALHLQAFDNCFQLRMKLLARLQPQKHTPTSFWNGNQLFPCKSLRLLRTPSFRICPGPCNARAEVAGASFSHPRSEDLNKKEHSARSRAYHGTSRRWHPQARGGAIPKRTAAPSFQNSYDHNHHLIDGPELSTAIAHVQEKEGNEEAPPMREDELINLIDGVLREYDKNNDEHFTVFPKSLQYT
uniref:Uncharacterized protein n=1 Tax=Catagonus wagneri TaxID=51154 RepID=A0A8C3X5X3_9CETA